MEQFDTQSSPTESLISIVKDDKSLLEHGCKVDINIHRLSQRELTSLLSLVQRLLATISYAHHHCFEGGHLICSGKEIDVDVDVSFLANLEHCLLCLQTELVRALLNHGWDLVQKHVIDCQKEQHRRCDDWFSEFPNSTHPLSTTWPWSIRPSLAVLWGVCWMFYSPPGALSGRSDTFGVDADGNVVDIHGRIFLTARQMGKLHDYQARRRCKLMLVIDGQEFGVVAAETPRLIPHPTPRQAALSAAPPSHNVYQSYPGESHYVNLAIFASCQLGQVQSDN